ncbi:MAG: CDGSH iron-sulfur domain-containing protein [Candidatus Binatia bacterium]
MADVVIKALKNGPYEVKGRVNVMDYKQNAHPAAQVDTIYLCRCGASAGKPFCDGTHSKIGFKGEETAA